MNSLSLYCGLTDSRMSASDTDLPVLTKDLDSKKFAKIGDLRSNSKTSSKKNQYERCYQNFLCIS